jgi:hypothetical protein
MLATLITAGLAFAAEVPPSFHALASPRPQDPIREQVDPPAPPKAPEPPPIKVLTDAEARTQVAEWRKVRGNRNANLQQRMEAIQALAQGSHRTLVAPLRDAVLHESAVTVRRLAAEGLAHQPQREARAALLVLLKDKKVTDNGPVTGSVITALSAAGYQPADWDMLEKLFGRNYETEWVPMQKAILALAIKHKEKQAAQLLLDNLDEPAPVDVDDPSNPPAEYWKARWHAWASWKGDVAEGMFAITGQRFGSGKEARNWLRENGPRQGIRVR